MSNIEAPSAVPAYEPFKFEIRERAILYGNQGRWVLIISQRKPGWSLDSEFDLTDVEFAALYGAVASKISGVGLRPPCFETPVSERYKVEPGIGDYWRIRDTGLNLQATFPSKQLAEIYLWHLVLEPQFYNHIFWFAGGAK